MKRNIRKEKKASKMINKHVIILLLLLILFAIILVINREKISNKFFPIYKVEDRTKNVEKLKKKSKKDKVIGWIKVQGTNIDMPVSSETYPSLDNYAWINKPEKKLSDFIPIFGHNYINVGPHPKVNDKKLQRFEPLMAFVYSDFADKNKYIQFTFNNVNYLYQIYGVSIINDNEVYYFPNSITKTIKKKFIKDSLKESIYKYDIDVNKEDKLISLYTCTRLLGPYHYYLKVDGKLVKNSNKGYNYDMHEKKGYKKIKKLLEGDGEDV